MQRKVPEPIPVSEARWDWEWMSSWGLLSGAFDAESQINAAVQRMAHGGTYRVRGGAMERLEGEGALPSVIVVLEFPSMDHARAWYNDPEYAPLIALRQTGSELDFVLVEGV